jgi:hypothetical protein
MNSISLAFVQPPLRGLDCLSCFPTADAVGYHLTPLRGCENRKRPVHYVTTWIES